MRIRTATGADRDGVRAVYLSAFGEEEREAVAGLAVELLSEEPAPRTISLVAESAGTLVGHVAFSPVTIAGAGDFRACILAPLAVEPAYQRRGIGSKLVGAGMAQLSEMGVDMLFVYGDPEYYGRFGFSADVAHPFIPPYRLQYPFGWQGIILNERATARPVGKLACVRPLCDPELW
jgi:putative acetyltransferase